VPYLKVLRLFVRTRTRPVRQDSVEFFATREDLIDHDDRSDGACPRSAVLAMPFSIPLKIMPCIGYKAYQ